MKLPFSRSQQPSPAPRSHSTSTIVHPPSSILVSRGRPAQSGSAVIVVLALLSILLIYVAGNIRILSSLGRELRLLEHQQTLRLQQITAATNTPPATLIPGR